MKPSVTLFLDTRTTHKMTGKHPLKIRVGVDRNTSRLFGIDFSFTKKEYEKIVKNQLKDPYKDTWNKLVALIDKADSIIDGLMPYFSFDLFKEQFYNDRSFKVMHEKTSLIYVRDFVCKKYRKNNNLPMSVKITDSVASILKFTQTENLSMRSITQRYVKTTKITCSRNQRLRRATAQV